MQQILIDYLEAGHTAWNQTLDTIISLLTMNPESISGGAPFALVQTIYTALSSIGYTVLVLCFLLSVGKEVTDVRQMRRPEWIFMALFRLIIAQAVLSNGLTILRGIYSFIVGVIELISGTTLTLQSIDGISDEVRTAIMNLDFIPSIGLSILGVAFFFVMNIASVFIIVTVYMRFFRLFMLMAIAPLFLGTLGGGVLGGSGISRSGFGYLQNHVSICLEGVGLVIACLLYSAILSGGLPHILAGADATGTSAVLEYIVYSAMQALMLCIMIKGIDHLMQNLVKI